MHEEMVLQSLQVHMQTIMQKGFFEMRKFTFFYAYLLSVGSLGVVAVVACNGYSTLQGKIITNVFERREN